MLLLEAGPHLTAVDFDRWEAKANHTFWWPIRFGHLPDGDVVAFLAGRCVGGTTTINTKVALRAHEKDVAKWHGESGPDRGRLAAVRASPISSRTTRGSRSASGSASAATGSPACTRSSAG